MEPECDGWTRGYQVPHAVLAMIVEALRPADQPAFRLVFSAWHQSLKIHHEVAKSTTVLLVGPRELNTLALDMVPLTRLTYLSFEMPDSDAEGHQTVDAIRGLQHLRGIGVAFENANQVPALLKCLAGLGQLTELYIGDTITADLVFAQPRRHMEPAWDGWTCGHQVPQAVLAMIIEALCPADQPVFRLVCSAWHQPLEVKHKVHLIPGSPELTEKVLLLFCM
ncbi:hypothetical protein WJX82_003989 [Trebouxia sp. C0006]